MKKILPFLILTVVIVFLIIKSNSSSFSNKNMSITELSTILYNGDKYNGYRLADVVFYPDYLTSGHKYSTRDHIYMYPDTIGVEYLKKKYPFLNKIKNKYDFEKYNTEYIEFEDYINKNLDSITVDIDILNELIKKRSKEKTNINKNTLVLHIRVGDVLCKKDLNFSIVYSKAGDINWWNDLIYYIKIKNISNVIILSGTHFKECLYESAKYIDQISSFLETHDLEVNYRICNSADDDLVFCQNEKHFTTTGGGYGYFLGKIVELNGGNFILNKKETVKKDRSLF